MVEAPNGHTDLRPEPRHDAAGNVGFRQRVYASRLLKSVLVYGISTHLVPAIIFGRRPSADFAAGARQRGEHGGQHPVLPIKVVNQCGARVQTDYDQKRRAAGFVQVVERSSEAAVACCERPNVNEKNVKRASAQHRLRHTRQRL